MSKSQFKMPSVQEFLDKKTIYGPKKDPVWVYLEKEMREMEEKGIKPYNKVVGDWLRFLRDLKHHYYCEAKRKENQLIKEIGPSWFCELSAQQREVLAELGQNIHQDIIENLPNRTRKSLADLGLTLKIPKAVLLNAMLDSVEDPGVFIWNLYTAVYKTSPSKLRSEYDLNSRLLMSSLVFIDLDECIDRLEKLTEWKEVPTPKPKKKENKYFEPKCQYGVYLQRMYAPCYTTAKDNTEKPKAKPLRNKLRLRSKASYEKLAMDTGFLEKRKKRNKKETEADRVCNYPFWEPPGSLRNSNPKEAAMANKLKMIRLKAKPRFKAPYKNVQYVVSGVVFCKEKPQYCLTNLSILPTGYIPIHGGLVSVAGDYMPVIQGYWKFPREERKGCHSCTCLHKWEETAMKYVKESKCRCGHLYDLNQEGKAQEKYIHQATRDGPYWIDKAKVFQLDPMEDFIKDCVRDALMSKDPSAEPSEPTLAAAGLKESDLLCAFLADISDSPLIIPHLPQVCHLNNLKEWVRKRVKGDIDPKEHKKWLLQSQRRWQFLKHKDFRERAYRIPFTLKELKHMTWAHRKLIMTLFRILLNDFVTRNQLKQLEQSRLWWATTKYDPYASKAFLDIFFTYMPARMKDTFMINPYSSELTPKYGAKTCPLLF